VGVDRPPKVDLIEAALRGGKVDRGGPGAGGGGETGSEAGPGVMGIVIGVYWDKTGAAEGGRERFREVITGGSYAVEVLVRSRAGGKLALGLGIADVTP